MIGFVRCWIKAAKNAMKAATPKVMAAPPAEVGCSSMFPHLCFFFIVGDFLVWVPMGLRKRLLHRPRKLPSKFWRRVVRRARVCMLYVYIFLGVC